MKFLSLGEKIRRLRKEKGLTLEELSADIATKSYISLIENNKSIPRLDVLKHIAMILEVNLEELVKDEATQAKEYCDIKLKGIKTKLEYDVYDGVDEELDALYKIIEGYKLDLQLGKYNSTRAYMSLKNESFEEALMHFHKAIRIYLERGYSKAAIIENYHYIGYIYMRQNMFKSALDKYKICEQMMESEHLLDEQLRKKIHFNLSVCYYELGLYDKALDYISFVTSILDESKNTMEYGRSLMHKGNTYVRLKEYKKAKTCFEKALQLSKQVEDRNYEAYIENNLGKVYLMNGNEERGLLHLNNALTLKKLYQNDRLVNTLLEYVVYYRENGELQNALSYLEEAEKSIVNKEDQHKVYTQYFDVYMRLGDKNKAKEYIILAINLLETMELPTTLSSAYKKYADFLEEQGNLTEAILYLKKSLDLRSLKQK